jgi:hypothetical protein
MIMSEVEKELFNIYMKLDKEDIVKLLIKTQRQPVMPNQIVYPQICPPQLPDNLEWPPNVWYTTHTDNIGTQTNNLN